jgi:6-phosphofructokinase 1
MAGRTDLVIGRCNGRFTHVPLALAMAYSQRVRADGELWSAVMSATGQPSLTTRGSTQVSTT